MPEQIEAPSREPICHRNWMRLNGDDRIAVHIGDVLSGLQRVADSGRPMTLITSGGDWPLVAEWMEYIPPNLRRWYGINAWCQHSKLRPIPVGIPSDSTYGNWAVIERNMNRPKTWRLFACFAVGNNPAERESAMRAATENVHGVTSVPFYDNERKPLPHGEFIACMAQHKFVLSPPGNTNADCHRTWEALYLGCIPICKRSPYLMAFGGLPILMVDDWSELADDLLDNCQIQPFDPLQIPGLWMDFWIDLIGSDDGRD